MDSDTIQILFLMAMFMLVPFYLIWWAKNHPQRYSAKLNLLHGIPMEQGYDYCVLNGEQLDEDESWEDVYAELYKNGNVNARQMIFQNKEVSLSQLRSYEILLLEDGWQLFASPFETAPFRLIYRRETGQSFNLPDPVSLPTDPTIV